MSATAGWTRVPLSEAYWFQEGPGVRKWQFTTSGIKLLNVGNIEKDGTLNLSKTERCLDKSEVEKKYSHFLVDAGDLVIASSGISFDDDGLLRTRGAFVEKRDLPLCLNTSTIRFKAIEDVSDLRFLRIWLNGREFRSQITKLVTGTAQQNFGPSHLKATRITLPSLAEQRRIAEVLDRAEALRAKRRAALAQLDTLTQSIFLDLFGDPATNPKGWPVHLLQEVVKQGTIVTYGIVQAGEEYPAGVPYIRTGDIVDGEIVQRGLRHTDPAIAARFLRSRVEAGEIVISIRATVGTTAVVPPELDGANLTQGTARIAPGNLVDRTYLLYYLRTSGTQHWISLQIKGATFREITLSRLRGLPVQVPPMSLQCYFARCIAAVETLRTAHRASITELDALFAVLQHRAFRGEL